MLARKFRLRTKDVKFLTHKRNYFPSGLFWFFYFKQYENLKFNQISFHISLKFSKKAVQRNKFRRCLYNYALANKISDSIIWNSYYKIFVVLQKNKIEEFKKQIENLNEKDILTLITNNFSKSLSDLKKTLSR